MRWRRTNSRPWPSASAIWTTAGRLRRGLYFDEVRELAETVRQHFDGPLILGGSGFSVSPQGWMRRLQPDCGVIGEGERAFPEVLARLETGRSLEGIEGVITTHQRRRPRHRLPARAIERLRELPLPAHDLCSYARVRPARRVCRRANQARVSVQMRLLHLSPTGGTPLPAPSAGSGGPRKLKPWPPGRRCAISFSWTVSSTIRGAMRWRSASELQPAAIAGPLVGLLQPDGL